MSLLDYTKKKLKIEDIEWVDPEKNTQNDLIKFPCQIEGCSEICIVTKGAAMRRKRQCCKYHSINGRGTLCNIKKKLKIEHIEWVDPEKNTQNDLIKFPCQIEGCTEICIVRKDAAMRRRPYCKFHLNYTKRPTEFKEFMKYIKILYPLYLDNFNFIEEDFYDDLKKYELLKKSKKANKHSRKVTAWCKKHNKKICVQWGHFFGANGMILTCKNCSKHGISQEQIYIMNFLSEILNIYIRHEYNHIEGEFCDLSINHRGGVDGFCNEDKTKIINSINKNNTLLQLKILENNKDTNYKGFIFEYSPENYHKGKEEEDKRKINLYMKSGYCVVILKTNHFLEYKKSNEWKNLQNNLNKKWMSYKIRPSSFNRRTLEHVKNTRNTDEMFPIYINKSNRAGFSVTICPSGCDNFKSGNKYKNGSKTNQFGSIDLFTEDELYSYAVRTQEIIVEYVKDCCQNIDDRKITFEEKESRIRKIYDEYEDEKRKKLMNNKIALLKSGYYTDKFNMKKIDAGYNPDTIGIYIKFVLDPRSSGGDLKIYNLTYSNNITSYVSNYFENLDDMIIMGELYIKYAFYPEKYQYKYEETKENFIKKALIKKYTEDIYNSNKEFIGIKLKYMKSKTKTGKAVIVFPNSNRFYLKHTKPDRFKIIRGLSKNEEACRKIVQLYMFSRYFYMVNDNDKYINLYEAELEKQKELYKICDVCGKYITGRMDRHMKNSHLN